MKNPNLDDVLGQLTDILERGTGPDYAKYGLHETVLTEVVRAIAALSNIKAQIEAAHGGQIAVPVPAGPRVVR